MKTGCSIISALHDLGEFQFMPNHGNLGDLLIDVATRQLFKKWNLPAVQSPCPHLVYGGGGRFVPFYGPLDALRDLLTAPHIKRCIILPHSFFEVDDFVRALDERHIVFCRDAASLAYCQSLNNKALFLPAHDMALCLDPSLLCQEPAESEDASLLAWEKSLHSAIRQSAFRMNENGVSLKCAFFPRIGKERALPATTEMGVDLSGLWTGSGNGSPRQFQMIRKLLDGLSTFDVVFSDRLHLCISAFFAGCRVCLLDNNYGKLSGVYHQSLSSHPRLFLLNPSAFGLALQDILGGSQSFPDVLRTASA